MSKIILVNEALMKRNLMKSENFVVWSKSRRDISTNCGVLGRLYGQPHLI